MLCFQSIPLFEANLILNVDGCIAVCFVDLLRGCGAFTRIFSSFADSLTLRCLKKIVGFAFLRSEADELVSNGVLNGLFVSPLVLALEGFRGLTRCGVEHAGRHWCLGCETLHGRFHLLFHDPYRTPI